MMRIFSAGISRISDSASLSICGRWVVSQPVSPSDSSHSKSAPRVSMGATPQRWQVKRCLTTISALSKTSWTLASCARWLSSSAPPVKSIWKMTLSGQSSWTMVAPSASALSASPT